MKHYLEFKWTVSRARDTHGYNICTLYVDSKKAARCNGGGYDMEGTVLGNWFAKAYKGLLVDLEILTSTRNGVKTPEHYGLTYHDSNFDPGKEILPSGKTVEQAEKDGDSLGLDRYQTFYKDSSKVPTERHVIPLIDGACGMSSVEKIINACDFTLKRVKSSKNLTVMVVEKTQQQA